jgi:hypothetical protein
MKPSPPPQLTAVEFNTALKEAGFGVQHARIIDVSGRCPGFMTTPTFRGRGVIDRTKTLAKVVRERDAEIKRRSGWTWTQIAARLGVDTGTVQRIKGEMAG